MFDGQEAPTYQNSVEGIWGEFETSAGKVAFIQTKARLGEASTDNERRLTQQLRPVREVLPTEKLDFNQLLQRDLDDDRVAEELIPYLLRPGQVGPAFFPPIMAVLLPFSGNTPRSDFPESDAPSTKLDPALNVHWWERQYGSAFAVRRLADKQGTINPIKLGRLLWNEEHCKLVVLDGQHRAMALIAIDRTLNASWGSAGNRYRHFYEKRVSDLIKNAGGNVDLKRIEVPVTVCWFPELSGPAKDPHRAARKLFVDVNKEARTPSEARLTLLSDGELLNILTRSLLNRLRQSDSFLPLYSIEYDNPDRDSPRPVRWSVLTNLNLLKFATQRCVFGPVRHLKKMSTSFVGKPPVAEMDAFMRQQLDVHDLFPETIVDGEHTFEREKIQNTSFPLRAVDKLVDRFLASWGGAILLIFSRLRPYEAHWHALEKLKNAWHTDDSFSSLAYDALFAGMGMFWTLRSSHHRWQEERTTAFRQNGREPARPDTLKAWEVIEKKAGEFSRQRAIEYLGKRGDGELEKCEKFYAIVNTHACQLGAVLTVGAIAYDRSTPWSKVVELTGAIVEAWNAALDSQRTASENRRLVLARSPVTTNPLNGLGKLDTTFALYFRYFWLELLLLDAAQEKLKGVVPRSSIEKLADEAREFYAKYLVDERLRGLMASQPGLKPEKGRPEAQTIVIKELATALKYWFTYSAEEAQATAKRAVHSSTKAADEAQDVEAPVEPGATAEEAADAAVPVEETPTVEDLLANMKQD